MKITSNTKHIILTMGISLALVVSACSPIETPVGLTPITLQLQWTHLAEFAGFYAADQNGYYAGEGLAVTFVQGGGDIDYKAALLDGKAHFGTATADELIVARSEGKPLRAIAAIYRRSPTVFITLADSGITRPQDFIGKTIRIPANLASTLHAMTSRVGISPELYKEVFLPSDVNLFASGEVPVWGVYLNGLAVAVQQAGYEINLIYPDDYGVHFYGDVIITTDDLIENNPDLVLRFLRASLKGWTWAVENPSFVGSQVVKYEPKADVALENVRMNISIPLVHTGEDHIGWMKPETWTGMEETLREQGVLAAPLEATQVYTMQFLEAIYK